MKPLLRLPGMRQLVRQRTQQKSSWQTCLDIDGALAMRLHKVAQNVMAGGGRFRRAMFVAPPDLAHLASADDFHARSQTQLPPQYPRHLSDSLVINGQDVGNLQHNLGEAEGATILSIRKRLRAITDRRATEIAPGT